MKNKAMFRNAGDDLALGIGATGDALLIKDFYLKPQAWQEDWSIREAGSEEGFSIAALQSVPPPLAGDWLAAQKTSFRTRREQAFGAGREAQEYAATGGNAYTKVEWGFNYAAQVSTTTTTVNRLVTSTLTSSAASINAFESYFAPRTATGSVRVIGRPTVRGTSEGRAPVYSTSGTTAELPEGAFIPTRNQVTGALLTVIPLGPGDQLVPDTTSSFPISYLRVPVGDKAASWGKRQESRVIIG